MQQENTLVGKKVAILIANGFEQSHMTSLHKCLVDSGAEVKIVSPEKGVVNSWHNGTWGHFFPSNAFLPTSMSFHFDAVIVPGGERHVNRLCSDPQTARFMRGFMEDNKPVALFEEAVKVIAVDDLLDTRTVAAAEAVAENVTASNGIVKDEPVIVDDMLVTATGEIDPLVERFMDNIREYEPEAWEAA
ncbi:DJ-1/PfpI family protein [Sneathiella chinensis]|uniref:Protease n=1 Tax=Sneathiella chinensis TaxID=349750 RepID=A0ABQ5U586_9PROT|nr:DJ-1/PfpI family protein [Sneathiella chinensis]GLQ07335.1 protease [Sneathiella chinensis]